MRRKCLTSLAIAAAALLVTTGPARAEFVSGSATPKAEARSAPKLYQFITVLPAEDEGDAKELMRGYYRGGYRGHSYYRSSYRYSYYRYSYHRPYYSSYYYQPYTFAYSYAPCYHSCYSYCLSGQIDGTKKDEPRTSVERAELKLSVPASMRSDTRK